MDGKTKVFARKKLGVSFKKLKGFRKGLKLKGNNSKFMILKVVHRKDHHHKSCIKK
jgi:hypothetical protein